MISFSNKIGYDIKTFFEESLELMQVHHSNIVSYFVEEGDFSKEAFGLLDKLENKSQIIYSKLRTNRNKLNNFLDFVIFDQIEDFISVFRSIQNYSRWYKSSIIKGRFKTTTEVNFVLRQNQTLENLSQEIGWQNQDEGALDLALRNKIKETDYDLQGGLIFKFAYQNEKSLKLQTVVDEMTGENLLGKDIQAKLEFKNDDLVYLTPQDTFHQTCEILTNLMKNSNPEFPNDGFDKSAISNKNLMKVRLPSFIRQIYAVAKKDDTIASFSVSDIVESGDSLRIEMQYRSYLNSEPVKKSVYGN